MQSDPNPRDPVLDVSLVLRLARRHLPSAEAVTGVDESGGEARTYAIDEGFIFKTQRPHRIRPRTSLEKETFHLVQPNTLQLTGIIDFGDAYISHPALDMRRWGAVQDRKALIDGYAADSSPGATFLANWRVISVANLMLDFAQRPARRAEALASLQLLLAGSE